MATTQRREPQVMRWCHQNHESTVARCLTTGSSRRTAGCEWKYRSLLIPNVRRTESATHRNPSLKYFTEELWASWGEPDYEPPPPEKDPFVLYRAELETLRPRLQADVFDFSPTPTFTTVNCSILNR